LLDTWQPGYCSFLVLRFVISFGSLEVWKFGELSNSFGLGYLLIGILVL